MLAVGTYGIAFIARPVGGIVLGVLADRVGRKPALNLTLSLMALGSLGVACAPTPAQVGLLGPIWLLTARLIQGFALGGEVGASTSMLLEYATEKTRGYYSSWQMFSQALSSLAAATMALRWSPSGSGSGVTWMKPYLVACITISSLPLLWIEETAGREV